MYKEFFIKRKDLNVSCMWSGGYKNHIHCYSMKVSYADMNTPYKLILRNILYLSYYGAHWKRNHYINFFIRSIGLRNWLSNKMEFSVCIFGSFPFFLICIPWTLYIDVFFWLFFMPMIIFIYMGAYLNKTFPIFYFHLR